MTVPCTRGGGRPAPLTPGSCARPVADVKPRHLLARPKVAFSLGWAREAVESRRWEFEAWCEPPEAELANVRFLAGYRRAWVFDPELVAEIRGADLDGATLGEAFRAFPRRPAELARAGVLHLLWAQHLVTDLATPLSARHRLRTGVPAEVTGAGTRELPRPAAVSADHEDGQDPGRDPVAAAQAVADRQSAVPADGTGRERDHRPDQAAAPRGGTVAAPWRHRAAL